MNFNQTRVIDFGSQQISGGAALIVPRTIKLIEYAKQRGIYNGIATNGKLLTPQKTEQIMPYVNILLHC